MSEQSRKENQTLAKWFIIGLCIAVAAVAVAVALGGCGAPRPSKALPGPTTAAQRPRITVNPAHMVWDANPPEENIIGYWLLYGKTSGSHPYRIWVNDSARVACPSAPDPTALECVSYPVQQLGYWWSVKAVSDFGMSKESSEVRY